MNKKSTTVTALVPAYQAVKFIQPTLDSLSAQIHPRFSVIISVDLCDDPTYDVCLRHAQRDPRFRVFRQSQRQGYVGNCNFLLQQADSDYVLFAFHDDILAPDYVQKLAAVLDARPEVINCYSDVKLTNVNGTHEDCIYTSLDNLHDRTQRGLQMLHRKGLSWIPNRGLFRLREARNINGLKTHGAGEFSADWPWLFHMSLLGEFARVPETLCHKIYKPGSLSRQWDFSKAQYYHATLSCLRELRNSPLSTGEKRKLTLPLYYRLLKLRLQMGRDRLRSVFRR